MSQSKKFPEIKKIKNEEKQLSSREDSIDASLYSLKEMDQTFEDINTTNDTHPFPEPAMCSVQGSPFAITTDEERDSKLYKMNKKYRGLVQIFNQEIFMNSNRYEERKGTDKDVERLKKALPRLGFKQEHIIVHKDLNRKEIDKEILKLEENVILKESDCLLTIILTHGERNDRILACDEAYHLYEFVEKFTPSTFKVLAGKPKIFIVQACRGDKHDTGVVLQPRRISCFDETDSKIVSIEEYTYPEYADFLIGFSSHHDHYSFRNVDGSWYIQEFCNAIEECDLFEDSIYDILNVTNSKVSRRISSSSNGIDDQKKQISGFYSTLTKKLMFEP